MAEVTTKVEEGEQLVVSVEEKRKYIVPFFAAVVEEKKVLGASNVAVCAADQFLKMSKSAHWLLWNLFKDRLKSTNIAVFRAKDNLEAKKITLAYNELHDLNIIKRVKRQHYIINPNVFLPTFSEYAGVCTVWNGLQHKELEEANGLTTD